MLAALVILCVLGLSYGLTIAPDLTWAHFSADGGDLIAAAATGGVPHPSGYPLYLLLARPFQWLPVGTLAFRTNLFSAVLTILTALCLYGFLLRQMRGRPQARFSALLAALAYGLAPFIWGQALVTEVYALHGLMVMLALLTLSAENLPGVEWLRGLVFGLAVTHHLTALLLFPLLCLNFQQVFFVSGRVLLTRCLGLLGGLSLYLLLPLRAASGAPVNWGNPVSLEGFFWLVSGRLYSNYLFSLSFSDILQRFRGFAGLLLEQYTLPGVLVGLSGLFALPSRFLRLTTLWIAGVFLFFSVFYGSSDSQVNLLPVWLVFAIWLAFGLQDLFELLHPFPRLEAAGAVLLLAALLLRLPVTFQTVDVSRDFRARDFINQAFSSLPPQAIVFIEGDEQIFSLWYAQFGLQRRPDLVLVALGLLPQPWYRENLAQTYPGLHLPPGDQSQPGQLRAANPGRATCTLSVDLTACLAP
jgi:hypothetical protein